MRRSDQFSIRQFSILIGWELRIDVSRIGHLRGCRYPSCIVDGGLTKIDDNANIRVLQR